MTEDGKWEWSGNKLGRGKGEGKGEREGVVSIGNGSHPQLSLRSFQPLDPLISLGPIVDISVMRLSAS